MQVRVLWVIKGLGPDAEHLLVAAGDALSPDRLHIECAFVDPQKDHLVAALERAGVRTHCLSTSGLGVPWPMQLAKLVRSGDWDVIHVHTALAGSVARLAVRTIRKASRPHVIARSTAELGSSYEVRARRVSSADEGAARPTRTRATQDDLEMRKAVAEDRAPILSLLRRSLGGDGDDPRFAELFAWKHDRNPLGGVCPA